MAIAKICGIETEYGIQIRGNESNPILASSLLISSYVVATSKNLMHRESTGIFATSSQT